MEAAGRSDFPRDPDEIKPTRKFQPGIKCRYRMQQCPEAKSDPYQQRKKARTDAEHMRTVRRKPKFTPEANSIILFDRA